MWVLARRRAKVSGALIAAVRDGGAAAKELRGVGAVEVGGHRGHPAGGVAALAELARGGSAIAGERAAGTLRALALNGGDAAAIGAADGIVPLLVELVRGGSAGGDRTVATGERDDAAHGRDAAE